MALNVEHITIEKLHGSSHAEIPIHGNRLILVGENGTGKSTVVSMLFFFLTAQWGRLSEYQFESITVRVNGKPLSVNKQLLDYHAQSRRGLPRFPPSLLRRLTDLANQNYSPPDLEQRLVRLARDYDMAPSALYDAIRRYDTEDNDLFNNRIREVTEAVKALTSQTKVLFLPTYRRIEQDLLAIFRSSRTEVQALQEQLKDQARAANQAELIAFGMEDVVAAIDSRMGALKDSLRKELSRITSLYLREVIDGQHDSVSYRQIEALSVESLDAIFRRLDEGTLSMAQKTRLRTLVNDFHQRRDVPPEHRVVAHFLVKLQEVHTKLREQEADVRKFVEICNEYLVNKRLQYDHVAFTVAVKRREMTTQADAKELELRNLSSGEKQIVSLFSHLHLGQARDHFVIIDEPELSLSIKWQKRFLPDILDTGRCSGLLAVTHSPFVTDNGLDPSTHAITEYVRG